MVTLSPQVLKAEDDGNKQIEESVSGEHKQQFKKRFAGLAIQIDEDMSIEGENIAASNPKGQEKDDEALSQRSLSQFDMISQHSYS